MTDDQIEGLWLHRPSTHDGELMPQLRDFARAIEKASRTEALEEAAIECFLTSASTGEASVYELGKRIRALAKSEGEST